MKQKSTRGRIGICIIGSNGAVATTMMSGLFLMKKGLVPKLGMVTEGAISKILDFASLDHIVCGGWDLVDESAYEAATRHQVIDRYLLEQIKPELSKIQSFPAITSDRFLANASGKNVHLTSSSREELKLIEQDILKFRNQHDLSRIVMVNLASTERFTELEDVHRSIDAFEKGLDSNDPRISPAMKYLYVACKMGIPHVNFTPSLTNVPALEELSVQCKVPIAGEDGKTGQTLIKTVLAPAFVARQLRVDGWFSTNILGNNDGLVLSDPSSNKTKVSSKQKPLDSIVGYKVENHQVHIHYYKPRGDAKEAWDNIDVSGFLGQSMQIKVDFLCKDSILAAPLVIDLARLITVAHEAGECGIQKQLSVFFKAPYHSANEEPIYDFFKQQSMLMEWAEKHSDKEAHVNGSSAKLTPARDSYAHEAGASH